MKKINGVESIKLVIRRAKKLKNISQIILATSKNKSDDIFTHIAKDENINLFRGSLNDVANRYYECAKKFKLDYIVRITGDAILFDEISLDKLIINHLNKNVDVSFIKGLPYGTAKEVISFNILKIINDKAVVKKIEYLEFFLENNYYFKISYLNVKLKFNKDIRLTLDFPEDRILFDKIYKYFKDKNCNFTLENVLNLLKQKPFLIKFSHHKPKFDKSEINTDLRI